MEVPRLDHALSSPSSPCEEIKNLSLEAIQLCDRDGEARRHRRETKGRGRRCPVRGRGRLGEKGASRVGGRRLLRKRAPRLSGLWETAPLGVAEEGYWGATGRCCGERASRVRGRGFH